jgi:hypothetical protein
MAVFGRGMRMYERDGRKWGDVEKGRQGEKETRRRGDMEKGRQGEGETRRQGEGQSVIV